MTMLDQAQGKRFMCLSEAFRTRFPWNHEKLTRDAFRRWARTQRKPMINIPAKTYRPMRDGKPVPMAVVEAFAEYVVLRQILPKSDCVLSNIADACGPPAEANGPKTKLQFPAWGLGWGHLFAHMIGMSPIDEEAYCADEADLKLAAEMAMECLAVYDDKPLTGRAAIAYGESVMGRTVEEYARQLVMLWQANEASVMFATLRRGSTVERIGVNVFIPMTEDFRRRYYAGETDDTSLTQADIVAQSMYVMIQTVAESRSIDVRRDKAARSFAHLRTFLYQLASLCLPVLDAATQPHLMGVAGTKEGVKRYRAYGFKSIGMKTVSTGKDIVELVPPRREKLSDGYLRAYTEYFAMKSLIHIHQAALETQRLKLD
jgi:hypothetical protein